MIFFKERKLELFQSLFVKIVTIKEKFRFPPTQRKELVFSMIIYASSFIFKSFFLIKHIFDNKHSTSISVILKLLDLFLFMRNL